MRAAFRRLTSEGLSHRESVELGWAGLARHLIASRPSLLVSSGGKRLDLVYSMLASENHARYCEPRRESPPCWNVGKYTPAREIWQHLSKLQVFGAGHRGLWWSIPVDHFEGRALQLEAVVVCRECPRGVGKQASGRVIACVTVRSLPQSSRRNWPHPTRLLKSHLSSSLHPSRGRRAQFPPALSRPPPFIHLTCSRNCSSKLDTIYYMPSMTLPANDAFTLGLTGSHDPSRPAYSLSFRSTSPKIPFVSSSKSSYSSGHPPKSPRQTRRSMSNGVPNGAPNGNGNGNHYSSESNTRRRTRTEQTSRTVAIKSESTALVKKQKDQAVDWEIPRKTLHSSIGASKSYPYLESPNNLDTLSPLFTGFLTLYLYTSHGSPKPVIVSLSLALAVIVPADILRLNFPWFERIYERCLGFLMRESEKVRFSSDFNPSLGPCLTPASFPCLYGTEKYQWGDMVYHRCSICSSPLPP